MARYSRPKAAPATTPTFQPCLRARSIRGIISRETEPPNGILKSTTNPRTKARATASAASVSTLVSLKAFNCASSFRSSGMRRIEIPRSPCAGITRIRFSGSAPACPLSLTAPRSFWCSQCSPPPVPAPPPALQSNPSTVAASVIPPSDTICKASPNGNSATLMNSVGSGRGPRSSLLAAHLKRWQTSVLHPLCPVASLFEELSTGRPLGLLAGIDSAARKLQREGAKRLPPLAHEHHVSPARDRYHGGEPAALKDTVFDLRPAR